MSTQAGDERAFVLPVDRAVAVAVRTTGRLDAGFGGAGIGRVLNPVPVSVGAPEGQQRPLFVSTEVAGVTYPIPIGVATALCGP